MKEPKFPMKLKLLPGLRWSGSLKVLGREPAGYTVAFDAVSVARDGSHLFIYDHAVLSAKQLEDWTGWKEPKP